MPAQTLAQKLIARAAGRSHVAVGEIVTCQVDLAMFHDSSGPRRLKPMLQELGAQIWDKSKVVLVMDHYVPEQDDDARKIVRIARDWARDQALPHVYDSMGICHVVLPQKGHLRPGMLCVGGDSHSPTGGAFGTYMFGVGSTEMLGVVVTGEIWLRVPQTIQMHWRGNLARGVTAKDMMLHTIGRFGMNGGQYQAVEFCGAAVQALSMPERMTLCNMSAELGAQTGLVAPDAVTQDWLETVGVARQDISHWHTDADAQVERHSFRCQHTATPGSRPPQPRQHACRGHPRRHAGTRCLHRCLHGSQAGRLARRRQRAARPQGGARRAVDGGPRQRARPAAGKAGGCDASTARCWRATLCHRLRCLRRLRRQRARRQHRHQQHGPQLQRPHGRSHRAGVFGLALHRGRIGAAWRDYRSARGAGMSSMEGLSQHRIWHLGADIDTDVLAPGHAMKYGIEVIAQHCLESVLPQFASQVKKGDVIVAGSNFGIGSSREQAAQVLVQLGIAAVIAPSYSGLYFRNAFNVGLLLLTCPQAELLRNQELLTLSFKGLQVVLPDKTMLDCEPIPEFLLQMVQAGGLLPSLKQRLQKSSSTS